jgi:hypothetical protein
MTEESLLTDELRALIGSATPPGRARITRKGVARATEVYYGSPLTGLEEGDIAPGVAIAGIESEAEGFQTPNVMPNSVLVSNEWEFLRPLRVGEELSAQTRLADISERFGGRFGYSLYFRTDVEFRDSAGELVARSSNTLMQYDARNARGGEDE